VSVRRKLPYNCSISKTKQTLSSKIDSQPAFPGAYACALWTAVDVFSKDRHLSLPYVGVICLHNGCRLLVMRPPSLALIPVILFSTSLYFFPHALVIPQLWP